MRSYHPDLNDGVEDPRLRDVTEAWNVLRERRSREAHLRALERQAYGERSSYRETREQNSRTQSGSSSRATASGPTIAVQLPQALHARGAFLNARVPVTHDCPSCSGEFLARVQCELCDGKGSLTMRVRGRVWVPPYVALGKIVTLDFELELFGSTTMQSIVRLV